MVQPLPDLYDYDRRPRLLRIIAAQTAFPPARRPVRAVFIWLKNKSLPRATARQRTLRTRDSAENAPAKNSISHERGKSRQGDMPSAVLKVGYLPKFIIDIPDAAGYAIFSESACAMKHLGCEAVGRLRHVQHSAGAFVFFAHRHTIRARLIEPGAFLRRCVRPVRGWTCARECGKMSATDTFGGAHGKTAPRGLCRAGSAAR